MRDARERFIRPLPTERERLAGRNAAARKMAHTDRVSQSKATRNGAVIRFLINNPLSTAKQILKATGYGVIGIPFLVQERDEKGTVLWSVNMLRYRRYLRTGSKRVYDHGNV